MLCCCRFLFFKESFIIVWLGQTLQLCYMHWPQYLIYFQHYNQFLICTKRSSYTKTIMVNVPEFLWDDKFRSHCVHLVRSISLNHWFLAIILFFFLLTFHFCVVQMKPSNNVILCIDFHVCVLYEYINCLYGMSK